MHGQSGEHRAGDNRLGAQDQEGGGDGSVQPGGLRQGRRARGHGAPRRGGPAEEHAAMQEGGGGALVGGALDL